MNDDKKGLPLFVVFEGVDGSGKSTLSRAVKDWYERKGLRVLLVNQPSGTSYGDVVRELQHSYQLSKEALLFSMLSCRADFVDVLKQSHDKWDIIIADRFELSTLAYQITAMPEQESLVRAMSELASDGIFEDILFYLDIPVGLAYERITQRGDRPDRFDEDFSYGLKVASKYEQLVTEREGDDSCLTDIVRLDGCVSQKELLSRVRFILDRVLIGKGLIDA